MTAPYVTRQVGSYNWANASEKQAQISVVFEDADGKRRSISELVEPEGLFDFDPTDIDIVDAVDLIEKAIENWWISTSREEKRAVIAMFRERQTAIRKEWLLSKAVQYQKAASRAYRDYQNTMMEYDDECDRELDQQQAA